MRHVGHAALTVLLSIPLVSSAALSPRQALQTSPDGSCGSVDVGGVKTRRTCDGGVGGTCCSQFGFCGSTPEYCGTGCQSDFGTCEAAKSTNPTSPTSPLPVVTPGRCGAQFNQRCPDNVCCSQFGFCGTTTDHCTGGCQADFGTCGDTEAQCGVAANRAKCPNDQCCGSDGQCGIGGKFCGATVCQAEFGACDKDITPAGPSTTALPRPKVGSVPYGPPIFGCAQDGVAALTFDDGPGPYTKELLRLLKENDFKATFFVIGVHILRSTENESIIKQIVADGHQLASHTLTHPDMSLITSDQRKREIFSTEAILARITNKIPTYFRAPMLSCDSACQQDVGNLGYHLISSNLDTRDFATQADMTIPKQTITDSLADIERGSAPVIASGMLERRTPADPPVPVPSLANGTATTSTTVTGSIGVLSASEVPTILAVPSDLNLSVRAQRGVAGPLGILSLQHDTVQKSVTELTPFFINLLKQKGLKGVTVGECLGDPEANWYRSL